jgi:hypothetical protein
LLFLFLIAREVAHGPDPLDTHAPEALLSAAAEVPRG